MAERDSSQCYIKVSVLLDVAWGTPGSEKEGKNRAQVGDITQPHMPEGCARPWDPAASQAAANNVAFRWCASGNPHSWCWACTSSAPTQAK